MSFLFRLRQWLSPAGASKSSLRDPASTSPERSASFVKDPSSAGLSDRQPCAGSSGERKTATNPFHRMVNFFSNLWTRLAISPEKPAAAVPFNLLDAFKQIHEFQETIRKCFLDAAVTNTVYQQFEEQIKAPLLRYLEGVDVAPLYKKGFEAALKELDALDPTAPNQDRALRQQKVLQEAVLVVLDADRKANFPAPVSKPETLGE